MLACAHVVTPNDMVVGLAAFKEGSAGTEGNLIKHFTDGFPRADAAFKQMTFGGKVAVSKILRALLKNQDWNQEELQAMSMFELVCSRLCSETMDGHWVKVWGNNDGTSGSHIIVAMACLITFFSFQVSHIREMQLQLTMKLMDELFQVVGTLYLLPMTCCFPEEANSTLLGTLSFGRTNPIQFIVYWCLLPNNIHIIFPLLKPLFAGVLGRSGQCFGSRHH